MTAKNEISSVDWAKYEKDFDNAFDEACRENPNVSVGFKLMYDQIPPQFIEKGKLQRYLQSNQVSLNHW